MNNRLSDEDMAITKHQMRHVLLCKKLGVNADKDAVRWLLGQVGYGRRCAVARVPDATKPSRGRDQGDSE
jgi:hypothetical protein